MTHSFVSGRNRLFALALSVLVLLFGAALHTQESNAKIEGSIVDVQGRAVVPATVTVKNEANELIPSLRPACWVWPAARTIPVLEMGANPGAVASTV